MTQSIPRKVTLPAMPAITSELPPDVAEWIEAVTTILEVIVGQGARGRNNELDRAVTCRDLLEGGLAEALLDKSYLVPDTSTVSTTAMVRTVQP